jgi:hypothetical protein
MAQPTSRSSKCAASVGFDGQSLITPASRAWERPDGMLYAYPAGQGEPSVAVRRASRCGYQWQAPGRENKSQSGGWTFGRISATGGVYRGPC